MPSDSKSKKRPYSFPTATQLTPEQARQFVADRANCSDKKAADFLESLRRERQQNDANNEKRKRSA